MILRALSAGWLAGSVAATLGLLPLWPLAAMTAAGVAAGCLAAKERRLAIITAACLAVALAAGLRYQAAEPYGTPGGIALLNDGELVRLRGQISAEPEQRERSQRFVLRVDAYAENDVWQATHGSVQVTTRQFPRFAYGDSLELTAKLASPPRLDGFDYAAHLARRGIVSLASFPAIERTDSGGGSPIVRGLITARQPFDAALARSLPEPESALARGILLGQRATIPAGVTEDFNRAGISHLIAISGWNVTLIAGLIWRPLAPLLGKRRALLAAMALVLLYAAFVGGSPSVLRAALMGEVMLGALLAGRPGSALTAVSAAGALLALAEPLVVRDVAFQLSFAATLGIVLLEEPLRAGLGAALAKVRTPVFVIETFTVTTAASIAVLPVIAATFGRISIVSLPANLLAVPAFPFVFGASCLTAVVGAVSVDAGRFIGEAAYLPLAYLVWVARLAGSLPYASLSLDGVGVREAALAYAALGAATLALTRRLAQPSPPTAAPRLRWTLALTVALALAAVFVWRDALDPAPARLTVTVLDVGQGDAILIETPAGHTILVDGGPSGSRLLQALGQELPASARRFDLVVLSHGQDDHVTGLVSLLDRYEVRSVLAGPLPGQTAAYRAWQDGLAGGGIAVQAASGGDFADLGGGLRLEVLNPPPGGVHGNGDDLNDNAVVLRLVYGDVSFLLTGDVEAAGEGALLAGGGDLRSTVLKVAHHGSDGSSLPAFLGAVDPQVAVISAGADNNYGHPSPTTLLRLEGVPFLRTDANGSVRFQTDGRRLWVQPERGEYRIVSRLAAIP